MPINDRKRISFTETLDSWLRQHFNIDANETDLANLTGSGNLDYRYWISSKRACDLYLRLWPDAFVDALGPGYWPTNTLVIARIEFADTRAGHGRALLDFFVSQAEAYGYDKIALECTYDGEGIQGFAKKFGFEHAWPKLERPHSNWIASVGRIAERLDQTVASP
jgi:GNAT superfamily N-acetyltransferase